MTYTIHKLDETIKGAYGLTVADMNGDGLPDLVVGSIGEPTIAWYAAPTFRKEVISTAHSGNITLAAHDLTGTGRPDLIVGSGFNRRDRTRIEYLHWLEAPAIAGEPWVSHWIEEIPFLHRLTLFDVVGAGQPVLIVASLRGAVGEYDEWYDPGGLWLYPLPADPFGPWLRYALDERLHLNHGLAVCDVDGDGRRDLLVGARDGLLWYEPPQGNLCSPWMRWQISPHESSECWAADLNGDGINEILSIEPWHGNQLVLYQCPSGDLRHGPWTRTLLDDQLKRGHSLEAVDLDGDGLREIVVGYNGPGTSLLIYHQDQQTTTGWRREVIDDGLGMGQMQVLDLDGDGQLEIVATGLSTGNVRLYHQD
ncbi:MAG: VCBS repeat-containing protein [Caldilineaceae bacterium]